MPDMKKVIKAAEICLQYIDDGDCPTECPYFDLCTKYEKRVIFQPLIRDALALLKEQEAKTGHWVSVNDGDVVAIDNDGFPERACLCSECKKYLIASDEYAVYGKYCPFCGAKMEGW